MTSPTRAPSNQATRPRPGKSRGGDAGQVTPEHTGTGTRPARPSRPSRALALLWQWFDTEAASRAATRSGPANRIDWLRCVPFFLVHVGCLAVLWVGWSPFAVAFALAAYVARMFAVTGFYHRYFSHRAFKTSRAAQFVFAVLGNSSAQRGPLWWASHHRHHHRHSDREDDAHSPVHHSLLWSHMLWLTNRSNFPTRSRYVRDLARFPELRFLDRFDIVVPLLGAAATFVLGEMLARVAPALDTNGPQLLVWALISTVVLFHATCTINSLGHRIGRQRFRTDDESRNSWLLALLTLGEGWHNNHHHFPASVRQGFYWWELDLTYYGLRLLERLGIIWDLRPVPEKVIHLRRLDGTGEAR